jgi:hypothetical protein
LRRNGMSANSYKINQSYKLTSQSSKWRAAKTKNILF